MVEPAPHKGVQLGATAEEAAKLLQILVEATSSSLVAFALYRTALEREQAVVELKRRLPLKVREVSLALLNRNPLLSLTNYPPSPRLCLFLYDLDDVVSELAPSLNLHREALLHTPHALVFWVREEGLRELALRAPDFWSWHSGVFDFRSALQTTTELQAVTSEPFRFENRGEAERRLGLYLHLIGEYDVRDAPDHGYLARLHARAAEVLEALGQDEEAEIEARAALEESRTGQHPAEEATAWRLLGIIALRRGKLIEAESDFRQSLKIQRQLGQNRELASTYHELGRLESHRGNFKKALRWSQLSLNVWKRLNDAKGTADALASLGGVARRAMSFRAAERYFREALETYEAIGDNPGVASAAHNLGVIAQVTGRYGEAVTWYTRALGMFKSIRSSRSMGLTYHNLGIVTRELGDSSVAASYFTKALEMFDPVRDVRHKVNVMRELARLSAEQGRPQDALTYALKSLVARLKILLLPVDPELELIARERTLLGEQAFQQVLTEALIDADDRANALALLGRNTASGPRTSAAEPAADE